MDVYIARQPVFDRGENVYGYELLYQNNASNHVDEENSTEASAHVINTAFFVMRFDELTGGTKGFLNFSKHLLVKDIPKIIPKDRIVIDMQNPSLPEEVIIAACKRLKESGYILALDNFNTIDGDNPLLAYIDIVKINFPDAPFETQRELIKRYGKRIKFLAKKLDTREEFRLAYDMGYDLFQGSFFSKPVIMVRKDIASAGGTMVSLITELNSQNPSFDVITSIIERDVSLSYKLLRLANSIAFGSQSTVESIRTAIIRIGINELQRWVSILLLKEMGPNENNALTRICLIRAKLMELICKESSYENTPFEFFLTGMFSSIDVLLNQDMSLIVKDLGLSDDVAATLLGESNTLRQTLDTVLLYEAGDWQRLQSQDWEDILLGLKSKTITDLYIEALAWIMEVDYLI